MSKYAFLFIDDGVDYQGDPTPEQQKIYGEHLQVVRDQRAEDQRRRRGAAADAHRDHDPQADREGHAWSTDRSSNRRSRSAASRSSSVPDRDAAIALAKTWPGYAIEIREIVEQRPR